MSPRGQGRFARTAAMAVAAVLAAFGAVGGEAPSDPRQDTLDARYRAQLEVARDESWLATELRRLRTYPHLDRAYRELARDDPAAARAELERVLALDPLDLEARLALVMTLDRLGDAAAAAEQADQLLAARPGLVPARLYRGRARAALGRAHEALEDFVAAAEAGLATAEDRAFARRSAADLASRLDRPALAERMLWMVIREDGPSPAAQLALARAVGRQGRAREAFALYEAALEAATGAVLRDGALEAADLAVHLGRPVAARPWLEAAHAADPDDRAVVRALARLAWAAGDADAAWSWSRALGDRSATVDDLLFAAEVAAARADTGEQVAALRAVLDRVPAAEGTARWWMALGHAEAGRGDHRAAAEAFERAAAVEPGPEALRALATALAAAGRRAEAVVAYRRLLARAPRALDRLAAARVLAADGQLVEARTAFARALEEGLPAAAALEAWRASAILAAAAGDEDAAADAWRRVLEVAPGEREAAHAVAERLVAAGRCDEAFAVLAPLHGTGAAVDVPTIRLRARALAGAGRTAEAIAELEALSGPPLAGARADDEAGIEPSDRRAALLAIASLERARGAYEAAAARTLAAVEIAAGGDDAVGLLAQAAEDLAAAGDHGAALGTHRRRMASSSDAEAWSRHATFAERAGALEEALDAWTRAVASAPGDAGVHTARGHLAYRLGRFETAREAFATAQVAAPSARTGLALARTYEALGRPGTALYQYERLEPEASSLPSAEQRSRLEAIASLRYREASYAAAAVAWRASLALAETPGSRLRLAMALRRAGDLEGARAALAAIPAGALAPEPEAQRLDELADLARAADDATAAVEHAESAYRAAPTPERRYRLGLAYRRAGRAADALEALEAASAEAPEILRFREAAGYAHLALGNDGAAGERFAAVLEQDPDFLGLYEDLGYVAMRRADHPEALRRFGQAIANRPLYPTPDAAAERALEDDVARWRAEVAKLRDTVDVSLYLVARGEGLPGSGASAAFGAGALPSQGGVELAWRPPRIGLRDERRFELFGRVLANAETGRLALAEETFQGGFGARLKPLRRHNLVLSGERLARIGERSEDNWLVRGAYSVSRGRSPRPGRPVWTASLFAEAGWYLEAPRRRALFAEARVGWAFAPAAGVAITPHFLLAGRDEDPGAATASYREAGLGLGLRLPLGRGGPVGRGSLELALQYRAGAFRGLEAEADPPLDESYEGLVLVAGVVF